MFERNWVDRSAPEVSASRRWRSGLRRRHAHREQAPRARPQDRGRHPQRAAPPLSSSSRHGGEKRYIRQGAPCSRQTGGSSQSATRAVSPRATTGEFDPYAGARPCHYGAARADPGGLAGAGQGRIIPIATASGGLPPRWGTTWPPLARAHQRRTCRPSRHLKSAAPCARANFSRRPAAKRPVEQTRCAVGAATAGALAAGCRQGFGRLLFLLHGVRPAARSMRDRDSTS